MNKVNRREVVKTLLTGAAGFVLAPHSAFATEGEKKAAPTTLQIASEPFKPKPLPFSPGKLTGLSEKLIQSHWENNYAGSVKTLNAVNKQLKEAFASKETTPFVIGALKREQLLRTGSVVNHELYFDNLGGNGKSDGSIKKSIQQSFGSEAQWEAEFKKIAASLSGGSGWVILGYNFHLKCLENYWCFDHLHHPAATTPLLVMDMYEHSYQMDYGAAAAKYIDAFFMNINWDVVNQRAERVRVTQ